MDKKAFILMGRSGCGKGTQANLLSDYIRRTATAGGRSGEVLYVQSGKEVRNFAAQAGYTAGLSKDANEAGGLQPEFLIIYMWASVLVRDYRGGQRLIFDGMPRKVHEAAVLDSVFEFYKLSKPQVVYIDVSADWSREHLLARARHDDTPEDIKVRLDWFEKEVMPTVEFYRKNPKYDFYEINGKQTPEAVHKELLEKVFGKMNP